MEDRLASIINDPLYQAISEALDTISYQHVELEDLFGNVTTAIEHLSSVLIIIISIVAKLKMNLKLFTNMYVASSLIQKLLTACRPYLILDWNLV